MKKITYVGPFDEIEYEHPVGRWNTVKNGAAIEVSDALAASFLEQTDNWKPAAVKAEKDGA